MGSFLATLGTGAGAGAVVAGVLMAFMQGMFGRGEAKAKAAQIITDAAGDWVEEMRKDMATVKAETAKVSGEMRQMRYAIEDYTEVVEGILPAIEPNHPAEAAAVRAAGRKLRRVI